MIFIIIYIYSYLYLCFYTFILTKAMQDVHICMYVCMHVCMYIYICFTTWLSTDVFHSWSKLKGIPRNNNEDRGPITSSTVFHSLKFKAMQDVHLCMYVCMYPCVYVCICFTRWLSTDVFHSWSLRYCFDPERPVP